MFFALALSAVVAAYNNLINKWQPFHGAAYVPVNLTFAGSVVLVTSVVTDAPLRDLGLRGDPSDIVVPLGGVALFAIAAFTLAASRHGHRIADERVKQRRGSSLASYVLVRIPFGTAIAEEAVFRGALFAAWREQAPTVPAAVGAAVVFGLWHIAPTLDAVRMNDPGAGRRTLVVAVVAAVVATSLAGLALAWLRVATGGLVAPIVLHAGVNSAGALAAAYAARRDRDP